MTTDVGRRQSCFLFYIYGFFLGLGSGVICAIVSFQDKRPATVPSKVLIVSACGLSVLTFIVQMVVGCRGESRAGQRSAIIAFGLIVTAALTLAGVAFSPNMQGVFFMSGAFSVVLYMFTVAAFSISFFRDRKYTRQAYAFRSSSPPAPWTLSNSVSISLQDLPNLGVANQRRVGSEDDQASRRFLSINELLLLGIPPDVALPEYSELPAATEESRTDPPPSYSEAELNAPEPPEGTENAAPPSYTEASSSPSPMLAPIQIVYPDRLTYDSPGGSEHRMDSDHHT